MSAAATMIRQLDNFLPFSIRHKRHLPREELLRARAMIGILGFSVFMPLVLLLTYICLQFFTDHDFSLDIYILIAAEVILVSQHIYFQSYGNLRLTAGAYSLQFLFSITTMIVMSGGWEHSPLMILLVCSPLIAFITLSYHAALLHVLLVFLIVGTLITLHIQGIALPDMSRHANHDLSSLVCWGVTLSFVALFLVFSESLLRASVKSLPNRQISQVL